VLEIAGFQFQPSEFMKVVIVIQLAGYFSSQDVSSYPGIKKLILPVAFTIVPVLLVLAEPDLGTAISLLAISTTIIFFVGTGGNTSPCCRSASCRSFCRSGSMCSSPTRNAGFSSSFAPTLTPWERATTSASPKLPSAPDAVGERVS